MPEKDNMKVDHAKGRKLNKGKQPEIQTPVNISEQGILKLSRPITYILLANLDTLPKDLSTREKKQLVDRRCCTLELYTNCREGRYRGRQHLFVYLTNEEDALNLLNQSTSIHNPDPCMRISFSRFDKSRIDKTIESERSAEADRTVKATNVPPEMDRQTLTTIFAKYGKVERLAIIKKQWYNIVYVVYELPTSTIVFNDTWSIFYKKEAIRVTPLKLTEEAIKNRTQHVIKLTGLPLHCYAGDLLPTCEKLNAKTVHVPRVRGHVRPDTTGFIYYDSEEDLAAAAEKFNEQRIQFNGRPLHLVPLTVKTCYACGDPSHEVRVCKLRLQRYKPLNVPLPNHLKDWDQVDHPRPQKYGNPAPNWDHPDGRSYAEAARGRGHSRDRIPKTTSPKDDRSNFKDDVATIMKELVTEVRLLRAKQGLFEQQLSVLNSKVGRLEKDRYGTTFTLSRDLETASRVNEVDTPMK